MTIHPRTWYITALIGILVIGVVACSKTIISFSKSSDGTFKNENGPVAKQTQDPEKYDKVVAEESLPSFQSIYAEVVRVELRKGKENKLMIKAGKNHRGDIARSVENGELHVHPPDSALDNGNVFIKNVKAVVVYKNITRLKGEDYTTLITQNQLSTDSLSLDLQHYADAEIQLQTSTLEGTLKEYSDAEMNGKIDNLSLTADHYSDIELMNESLAQHCEFTLANYSDAEVSGQAEQVTIDAKSYSDFDGSNLSTNKATIQLMDYSNVELEVTETLSLTSKNYSDAEIKGNPRITQSKTDNYSELDLE